MSLDKGVFLWLLKSPNLRASVILFADIVEKDRTPFGSKDLEIDVNIDLKLFIDKRDNKVIVFIDHYFQVVGLDVIIEAINKELNLSLTENMMNDLINSAIKDELFDDRGQYVKLLES